MRVKSSRSTCRVGGGRVCRLWCLWCVVYIQCAASHVLESRSPVPCSSHILLSLLFVHEYTRACVCAKTGGCRVWPIRAN